MARRGHGLSTAAIVLSAALVGCTPQSAPTPTPSASTGFSSDAEAFAAAEATYRAYVDAANAIDLSQPETFENMYSTLTGTALESARSSLTKMHEAGWRVDGQSVVTFVLPKRAGDGSVMLLVCLDVSSVMLVDSHGASQVGERPTEQSLQVAVAPTQNGAWRIESFAGRTGDPQCGS